MVLQVGHAVCAVSYCLLCVVPVDSLTLKVQDVHFSLIQVSTRGEKKVEIH